MKQKKTLVQILRRLEAALLAAGDPTATAVKEAVAQEINAQLPDIQKLEALYQAAGALSFQQFCEKLPGVTPEQAKQMNDLWIVYNSGSLEDGLALEEETGRSKTRSLSGALLHNDPAEESEADEKAEETGEGEETEEPPEDSRKPEPGSQEPPAPEADDSPASQEDGEPGNENAGSDENEKTPPEASNSGEAAGNEKPPQESDTVGGAVVDLITGSLDSASSQISQIQNQLTGAMKDIAGPTAEVVGDLGDLCGQLDSLIDVLDDAEDVSAALRNASHKIRDILGETDNLRNLLNDYEPTLQETLNTVGSLSAAAVETVRDAESLTADAESLLKTSGEQLDAGTRQALSGLSAALRQTARALGTTSDVRAAKDTVTGIIEDTWNEYTGDVNNLLLMDATAEPVSLTDGRNPSPTSIQILIRTQEIKAEEPEAASEAAAQAESSTFWGRIAQMFRDFWNAVTGIFR